MSKKIIVLILIFVVAGLGIVFINSKENVSSKDLKSSAKSASQSIPADKTPDKVIKFTENGYMPSNITIERGAYIKWINESNTDMWPAANLHPTHENYPAKGGCIGSQFDACEPIAPGESWGFIFNEKGSWEFHDHLAPMHTGTIIVE